MRRWILFIVYILIIVVLIAAIIFGFRHTSSVSDTETKSKPSTATSHQQAAKSKTQTAKNTQATGQATTPKPAASGTPALVNTGPSSSVAIVAGGIVIGYTTYIMRLRRKLS